MMTKLYQLYQQYWLVKWCWWLGIIIPGVPFILISISFILYMHWPRDFREVVDLSFDSGVEYVTLSAHGVKDTPTSWSDELQNSFAKTHQLSMSQIKKQHISLSWQPYSDNVFICSVAGKKIGNKLGEQLGKIPTLKGVHLIGHSCGSFVIFGICEAIKKQNVGIDVQTTYLDPVSVYSGIYWNYGLDNFGSCADFSDAYIDTEDTVPGSNQALPDAYTFDVTQTRTNNEYTPHEWPTRFYINAMKKKQVPIYFQSTPDLSLYYQKNTLMIWQQNK